jgi:hypothetical protein
MFNNDDTEETVNAFTLRESNGKYEVDENKEYTKFTYKELNSFNIVNKASIIPIECKYYETGNQSFSRM